MIGNSPETVKPVIPTSARPDSERPPSRRHVASEHGSASNARLSLGNISGVADALVYRIRCMESTSRLAGHQVPDDDVDEVITCAELCAAMFVGPQLTSFQPV